MNPLFAAPLHRAAVCCAVSLGVFLAACETPDTPAPTDPMPSTATAATPSFTAFDAQAKALLAQMTLAEKIGQMTQAEQTGLADPADIETYFLGSVLSGGNGDPEAGNSLQAWTDLYDRLQQHARNTRLGIPILYGIDAMHGHNNVLGAVIFPHNIGLGATRNADLVAEVSRITAKEVRATGIHWTFAPCVTVPQDDRWGRTYEGFAEDPSLVGALGEAAVRGLQGARLNDPLSVLACAKHYVGDGGTTYGTGSFGRDILDQGDMRVDEETMRRIHLAPYIPAIEAGVGSIMPSYSSWNGQKVSGDKYLLTDLLKRELGFEGFLISDYNAIDQIYPDDYKTAMGLMEEGRSHLADRSLHASFGSAEHRAVARDAVRRSLVLLQNEDATLPLSKQAARIHVGGKNADDIGNQVGGWTITWQGESGDVTPGGTTVLAAIRKAVSADTKVTFSRDGTGAEGADVGIVVIGETPYAEGFGDRADLALDEADVTAVRTMKAAGIPVVVILISGRPLLLDGVLDQADAFLAAWLPGTEGDGVADVLFGDYAPTGKLPFSWPRSMDQILVNVGDDPYDPLFEYGYGLTY